MLGLRGRYRTMISNCRRRRFGPAGFLGFRATVIAVDLVAVSLLTHKLRVWFPVWLDAHSMRTPSEARR
jgi:hypothetical protein